MADTSLAVPALGDLVSERLKASARTQERVAARCADITRRHTAARARWQEEARRDWDAEPMTTGRLAPESWDATKEEDWVLTANTLRERLPKLWDVAAGLRP